MKKVQKAAILIIALFVFSGCEKAAEVTEQPPEPLPTEIVEQTPEPSATEIIEQTPEPSAESTEQVRELSTAEIIDKNLEIIVSSDDSHFASNPYVYINAQRAEYDEIIAMGKTALEPLFAVWDSGERGLKGAVVFRAILDICPEANIVSEFSAEGIYRAETYGIDLDNMISGIYPAEGIRIVKHETNETLWGMAPGFLRVKIIWSPDGRFAAISYMARTYQETIIVDTLDMSVINLPTIEELQSEIAPKEIRPDPYFTIESWENSSRALISVIFTGEDDTEHFGEIVYDAEKREVAW